MGPDAGGNLPYVGAQAVLIGAGEFENNARRVQQGIDNIGNVSSRSTRSVLSFGRAMNVAIGVGLAGIARNMLQLVASAASIAPEFEKAIAATQAFGQVSAQQIQPVADAALALSRNYPIAATEIAGAATELVKAGASVEQVNQGMLKQVTLLADVSQGQLTLAQSAVDVTKAANVFNIEASNTQRIVNAVVGVVQGSVASFNDFDVAFRTAGGTAASAGLSIEEFTATVGIMADQGLQGTQIGSGLVQIFRALNKPTKDALAAMKEYGLTLYDANGKALPWINVLQELERVFNKQTGTMKELTDAERNQALQTIFNTRSSRAAVALAEAGLADYRQQLRNTQTDANDLASALHDNLIDQLGILANQLAAAAITLGGPFVSGLKNLVKQANIEMRNIDFAQVIQDEVDNVTANFDRMVETGLADLEAFLTATGVTAEAIAKIVSFIGEIWAQLPTFLGNAAIAGLDVLENFAKGNKDIATAIVNLFAFMAKGIIKAIDVLVKQVAAGMNMISDAIKTVTGVDLGHADPGGIIGALDGIDAAISSNIDNVDGLIGGIENLKGTIKSASATAQTAWDGFNKDFGEQIQQSIADAKNFIAIIRLAAHGPGELPPPIDEFRTAGRHPRLPPGVDEDPEEGLGLSFPPAGGSGAGPKGRAGPKGMSREDLLALKANIRDALSELPVLIGPLVDFIAGIAKDFPARLQPMIQALLASKDLITEMVRAKRDLLIVTLQIEKIEENLTSLRRQQDIIQNQQKLAQIGYDKQLVGLRMQELQLDIAEAPIRERIRQLDQQISQLQRENYEIAKARNALEIQLLPLKYKAADLDKQIAMLSREDFATRRQRAQIDLETISTRYRISLIDKQINDLNKTNFDLERQRLRTEQDMLPLKQDIADLDYQIAHVSDPVRDLTNRKSQLEVQREQMELAKQIAVAEGTAGFDANRLQAMYDRQQALDDQLKALQDTQAATDLNNEITSVGIQIQKAGLQEIVDPMQQRLDKIGATADAQKNLDDQTKLGLEEQKQALVDLLKPWDDLAAAVEYNRQAMDLWHTISISDLSLEKQAIEDQMQPLQDRIDALDRSSEAEKLRHQAIILDLEQEKQALEDQLIPFENVRAAIELQTKIINAQRELASLYYEENRIDIDRAILEENLRKDALEETKAQIEDTYHTLVTQFVDALAQSQAFTIDESVEVAKRIKMWDQQLDKLVQTAGEFASIKANADDLKNSIDAIPKDVRITITTIHKDVFEGAGVQSPIPGGESDVNVDTSSFRSQNVASTTAGRAATAISNATTVNNYYNMDFDANYAEAQSPVTVKQDVSSLLAMVTR